MKRILGSGEGLGEERRIWWMVGTAAECQRKREMPFEWCSPVYLRD
jgi:hypothetical protein